MLNHLIENGRVRSVAWSPDGNWMASGSDDKTIKVWNTKTGQCQSTLTVDSGYGGVQSVSFSPMGDMIAAGCDNGKIYLLDASTAEVKRSLSVNSGVESVVFSPDGSKIAAAYGYEIQLFDAQTQAKLGSPMTGHSMYVTAVSYSCLFSNV